MQKPDTYIIRNKGTVTQWVDLRPIFEVFAREQGFEGEWWKRRPLMIQEAPDEFLRETLAEDLQ